MLAEIASAKVLIFVLALAVANKLTTTGGTYWPYLGPVKFAGSFSNFLGNPSKKNVENSTFGGVRTRAFSTFQKKSGL